MSTTDSTLPGNFPAPHRSPVPYPLVVATLGAVIVGMSLAALPALWAKAGAAAGATMVMAGLYGRLADWWAERQISQRIDTVLDLIDGSAVASFVVRGDGMILHRNAAAQISGRGAGEDTFLASISDLFANPGATVHRLQAAAALSGRASEDVVTRRGQIRLTVVRVADDVFLWQIEETADRGGAGRGADALGLPMLTAGPSGTVLYMNETFRRLLGQRVKSLDRIFDDLPLVSGQIHRVRAADGPIDCLVAELSGSGGRREIYLLPAAAAPAAARDADRSEDYDDLPIPILRLSPKGEILSSNAAARDLLDHPLEPGTRLSAVLEGPGRPLSEIVRDVSDHRIDKTMQFVPVGGQSKAMVQMTLTPRHGADTTEVLAVLSDTSQLSDLENRFVHSQKMQAIGQLAGGVAHDFNNLLTAISGHCDLLLLRHDPGDPDYGDLVQIHQNANRAAGLVGQLLAFSRKQTLKPEVVNLKTCLADLTHLLNRLVGEKVRLRLDNEPALMPIRADKRQLEQVLMNLVVNARDAMPEGGEVRIVTSNETFDEPLERDGVTVPPGQYVSIRVIDEGAGIPPEMLGKIFDPFYTTKRQGEGTGLGLSTAYGIVKQTGGFIFVDSEVGQGTVFTIFIPATEPEAKAIEPDLVAPRPSPALPRLKPSDGTEDAVVLLVEDEAPVRAFAARALRLRGYTVLEAESAEAALDLLSDPDLKVDLFVTDVIMPGMDGPTWVREALATRPDARVVFVSGYTDDAESSKIGPFPEATFLPKPFSLGELTEAVRAQLA